MKKSIEGDNDGVYKVLSLGERGFLTESGKYSVRMTIEGKKKNLGIFSTEQKANEAYQNELENG